MEYLKKFESYKPEDGLVEYFVDLDSSHGGKFDVDMKFGHGVDGDQEYLFVNIKFLREYDYLEILQNISSIIGMVRSIGEFETCTEKKRSINFGLFTISLRTNNEDPWWISNHESTFYKNIHVDITDKSFDPKIFKKMCSYNMSDIMMFGCVISIREITIWFKRT